MEYFKMLNNVASLHNRYEIKPIRCEWLQVFAAAIRERQTGLSERQYSNDQHQSETKLQQDKPLNNNTREKF